MQPTDYSVRSVFVFSNTKAAKEEPTWLPSPRRPGNESPTMRDKIVRITIALSSVVMIALAGGASLRGF